MQNREEKDEVFSIFLWDILTDLCSTSVIILSNDIWSDEYNTIQCNAILYKINYFRANFEHFTYLSVKLLDSW